MSDQQNHITYTVYTEEQMTGFIEDGIIHETIQEIIHGRNSSELCDLIIYTDTNDPKILLYALDDISHSDLLWFITNREVIKTMFPGTYTNILSNTFEVWTHNLESDDKPKPHQIITAMLGLFGPDEEEDYNEVLEKWLTYENIVEIFYYLSELEPKIIIQSGNDKDLFQLLEQILLFKINSKNGDIKKTPCFYTTELQTYLDMLGNYVMPHIGRCDPMIVRAYDAMRQYLVKSGNLYALGIHVRIYILFANKFHDADREIFSDICQVICGLPDFVRFTTEYNGQGIFLECCRFDMPDELIRLLFKYDINPASLGDIPINYMILAKIFYSATQPEPRPQIHDALWRQGYFDAYIEWFKTAILEDLRLIDTCQWPLNVVLDLVKLSPYPNQDLINLKAYDSPALFIQFITLNDLTNTGEIQAEETIKFARILKDNNLTTRLFDTDTHIVSELKKHLQTTNGIFNPKLVRNKLVKLRALKNKGFISMKVYKCLEHEVFAKYIHSFEKSTELATTDSIYKLQSLLDEYNPSYTPNYWGALMKSALKANSDYFKAVIGILRTNYPDLAQSAPEPQMLLKMLSSKSMYTPKCDPESLIGKFAMILSEFYTQADLDHNDILNKLVQMPISRLAFSNSNYISNITTIHIYTTKTNYEFQLNNFIIDKISHELSDLIKKPLTVDVYCNIFSVLLIILEKHCDKDSARKLMLGYLTELFTDSENMMTSDSTELCIINTRLTHKYCEYIIDILDETNYTADVIQNEATDGKIKLVIRPCYKFGEQIQNLRWHNWCASRQIHYGQKDLALLTDPDTNEFICPITFDTQKTGDRIICLTGCGHKFSASGIIEWCRTKNTCPVCRSELATGKLSGANCEILELV